MAVGVPETDVFAAADRVLARGERPTGERVRAELGRGSPARVGQLLEQWWDALAKRLAGETALPELPPAVAAAFRSLWREAMAAANAVALDTLSDARRQLELDRLSWMASAQQAADAMLIAEQRAQSADHARSLAEARAGDLERIVTEQQAQLSELREQRVALTHQATAAAQTTETLRHELHAQQQAHSDERRTLQAYVEGVESRCAEAVDRAREETKALSGRIKQIERERADAHAQLERLKEESVKTRITLERTASREQARADLLEQQLKQSIARPPNPTKAVTAPRARASTSRAPMTPVRKSRRSAPSA